MILKWLKLDDGPYTLLIDRTNWEFGKKKINILMISVYTKDIVFIRFGAVE
ncbi:MAG: hypothetical protein IPO94_02700 [Saprospiraceae bacterium]|nr:hypothetical protein [Saprospiraceae bacterium]